MSSTSATVKPQEIRVNPVALRGVDKENEQFKNLVRDIKLRGLLLPVTVIAKSDELTGEPYYLLVDGLQRYSAVMENELPEINVSILDIDEADVMETQMAANLCKVDTKPIEYTRGLQRMIQASPFMTMQELADRISQSVTFITQRLSLLRLDESIQKLVNEGDIGIANAQALSKVPVEHQHELLDAAIAQAPTEFVPACNERAKELRAAAREGREAKEAKFEAKPRIRKLSALKAEVESPNVGPSLCASENIVTAEDGFDLGIKWALHLDPSSVKAGQADFDAKKTARAEAQKKAAAARETLKQQEAADKAQKAREEAGISDAELEELVKAEEEAKAERAKKKAEAKAAAEAAEAAAEVEEAVA